MKKAKLAIGVGCTCAGCDMEIVALNEKLVTLTELVDVVFWHFAADFKLKDLEAHPDQSIDIGLYHGALRTSEHVHIAHLLRKKCKVVIAFGSCACTGGIPALANTFTTEELFDYSYFNGDSMDNPEKQHPKTSSKDATGHILTLPRLEDFCLPLHAALDVDYFVPGCPPVPSQLVILLDVIAAYIKKGDLPPKGLVIAGEKTLCEECPREKPEVMVVKQIRRPHQFRADPNECLLSQGIVCMGIVTRGGCGALCPTAGMACRGCFGPPPGVKDTGAKMVSALSSIICVGEEAELGEEGLKKVVDQLPDPFGTFYRFSTPPYLIEKLRKKLEESHHN